MRKFKLYLTTVMLFLGAVASAQSIHVNGVVKDSAGNPIPGAGVVVQGTTSGVVTGLDGEYTITVSPNATLVFKAVSFKDAVVPVEGQRIINVSLVEDSEVLESSVVVGYGSARKIGNIVGSVKTVASDKISEKPSANIADSLQGKVAGLQVFNTSG